MSRIAQQSQQNKVSCFFSFLYEVEKFMKKEGKEPYKIGVMKEKLYIATSDIKKLVSKKLLSKK